MLYSVVLEKEMATHSSLLENPIDRGTWQATVQAVTRVGHNLVTKLPPSIVFVSAVQKSKSSIFIYSLDI